MLSLSRFSRTSDLLENSNSKLHENPTNACAVYSRSQMDGWSPHALRCSFSLLHKKKVHDTDRCITISQLRLVYYPPDSNSKTRENKSREDEAEQFWHISCNLNREQDMETWIKTTGLVNWQLNWWQFCDNTGSFSMEDVKMSHILFDYTSDT